MRDIGKREHDGPIDRPIEYKEDPLKDLGFEVGVLLEVQDTEHMKSVSLGTIKIIQNRFLKISFQVEVNSILEPVSSWSVFKECL